MPADYTPQNSKIAPSKYIYYSEEEKALKVTEEATTDAWRMSMIFQDCKSVGNDSSRRNAKRGRSDHSSTSFSDSHDPKNSPHTPYTRVNNFFRNL